jgi:hypothetical protein
MKKLHCVIHIGMPKTGSSAIQESLCLGTMKLQEHEYLKLGSDCNHSPTLYTIFMDMNYLSQYHWHRNAGRSVEDIERLRESFRQLLHGALENAQRSKVILSGEDLFHFDLGATERMKAMLDDYCASYQIIGYVRPPVSFMNSAFQQIVKHGAASDFNTSIDIVYQFYRGKLEKFDLVFGRENVKYIKFDPSTLYQQDIVQDFARQISETIPAGSSKRVNDAISLEALAVLYIQRKYGSGYGAYTGSSVVNARLIDALNGLGGTTRLRFATSLLSSILDRHRDDIRWMEERLGGPLLDMPTDEGFAIASEQDLIQFGLAQRDRIVELIARMDKQMEPTPAYVAGLVDGLMGRLKTGQ